MNQRIIIIDDHKVLIEGLISLLVDERMIVCATAQSIDDARIIIESKKYDVAVIDINLNGEDGLELIELVKKRNKPVIILSSYSDIRLIKEALIKGADGYINKVSSSDYIIEAINSVMRGENYFDPIIQQKLNQSFIKSPTKSKRKERSIEAHLTSREKEVLILIAQQYTSEEIASRLFIAKSTVDTYRKNLIEKLKVKNAVGLGLWAMENGLL